MEARLLTVFCLISATITAYAQPEFNTTCFDKFLVDNIRRFPSWIQSNNLDPVLLTQPFTIRVVNESLSMMWTIRTHGIRGYTKNLSISNVVPDFMKLELAADIEMTDNVTIYGNYSATGTVGQNQTEIKGIGSWEITVPSVLLQYKFNLTINLIFNEVYLREYNLPISMPEENGYHIRIENLFDNNFPEEHRELVEASMFNAYARYSGALGTVHPFRYMYLRFWDENLKDLTIQELLICSTPTPTSTPSTDQ